MFSACGRLHQTPQHPVLAQLAAPPLWRLAPLPVQRIRFFRIHCLACLSFSAGRARAGRPGTADLGLDFQGFLATDVLVLAAQI